MAQEKAKIAYYPGCSLNSTSLDYNVSIKKLLDVLGIAYEEIQDWNCCGTTPAHHTNEALSAALSARNLLLAKQMGCDTILSPCVSCYNKLSHAAKLLGTDAQDMHDFDQKAKKQLTADLEEMGFRVEQSYSFKNYSILNFLLDKRDLIRKKYEQVTQKEGWSPPPLLSKLSLACYYGCALLRPKHADKFDDVENPTSMEQLLAEVGIACKNYQFKTECCGAILSLTNKDVVLKLSKDLIEMTLDCGANSLVVFCQLCQQNLDLRQSQINRYYKTSYRVPVLYITQILGMALGLSEKEVMVDRLFVSPASLM